MVQSLKQTATSPAERTPRWLPWVALALLLMATSALVLWAGRGTVFRGDDWDLFLYRGGFNWDVFLAPHNEHLSALLVLAFKTIPAIAGPHYGAFRLALVMLDVAVAVLFFIFARERVGGWLALLATTPLLLMGGGSDNLIWPTQIGVVGSLACGIAVLILLDRVSLAAKAGACGLLTASIWFSSDGIFFLVCAITWLALSRNRWRDLWIAGIPILTYIAWYLRYGSSEFTTGNLRATPRFVLESAAGGVSALTGIRPQVAHAEAIGAIAGLLGLALLAALVVKIKPRVTPRLVAIVSLPMISWLIIALGRADGGDAFASRYVYASGIFILMAILEITRGDYLQGFFRGWKMAVLVAVIGVSTLFSAKILFEKGNDWRAVSQYIHGRTAAIELTRRTIDPNLALEPLPDMAHMTAGWYLHAVDKYDGSPTGEPDIASLSEQGRSAADQVLAAGAPAQFIPPPPGSGPTGSPPSFDPGSTSASSGSCLIAPPSASLSVVVPPRGLIIRPAKGGSAEVRLRRFASTYNEAPEQTVEGTTLLVIAADHSMVPWHAQISSAAQVSICGASADQQLRRGPVRPKSGNQQCLPMSAGEDECRFDRY